MPPPRIAVIEDDLQMRTLLAMQLRSSGLAVDCFGSAEDFLALRKCGEPQPDCVLLDVRLSGIDGLALQNRLVAEKIRLPIIFMSGHVETSIVVRAIKMGAFDFLQKPFPARPLAQQSASGDHQRRE